MHKLSYGRALRTKTPFYWVKVLCLTCPFACISSQLDCLYFIIYQLTFMSLRASCFLSLFLLRAKGHAKGKSKMRGIQLFAICSPAARYH